MPILLPEGFEIASLGLFLPVPPNSPRTKMVPTGWTDIIHDASLVASGYYDTEGIGHVCGVVSGAGRPIGTALSSRGWKNDTRLTGGILGLRKTFDTGHAEWIVGFSLYCSANPYGGLSFPLIQFPGITDCRVYIGSPGGGSGSDLYLGYTAGSSVSNLLASNFITPGETAYIEFRFVLDVSGGTAGSIEVHKNNVIVGSVYNGRTCGGATFGGNPATVDIFAPSVAGGYSVIDDIYISETSCSPKAVLSANIDPSTDTITITGHGFGVEPENVNLKFTRVSGTVPAGLTDGVVYSCNITGPDTLTITGITDAGTNFVGTLGTIFLGDISVIGFLTDPVADPHPFTEWTANGATNHGDCLNEEAQDGDTTYISTNISEKTDILEMGAIPEGIDDTYTVIATRVDITDKKTSTGDAEIIPFVQTRLPNTDYNTSVDLTAHSPSTLYTTKTLCLETDPCDQQPWTVDKLNYLRLGVQSSFPV